MATTTTKQLLQHPSHHHPLELLDLGNAPIAPFCCLCHRKISEIEAYTCQEGCKTYYYYHKVCVEAPPQIDHHPLHPAHPLLLIHDRAFVCDACSECFNSGGSSFWCHECDFDLDICCAFSTPSDEGGSQVGKTSERITLPLHPHTLTTFFSRHGFFGNSNCYICQESVEVDGYICLRHSCEFIIHKGCIPDRCYSDGTKAPPAIKLSWHKHALLLGHKMESTWNKCSYCEEESIGPTYVCEERYCGFLLHRRCMEIESTITHPHHPDHPLTLCEPDYGNLHCFCKACGKINYGLKFSCKSCLVELHVNCAYRFPTHKHYLHEHKLLRFEGHQDVECLEEHQNVECLEERRYWECNRCSTSNDSPVFRCIPCNFNLHEECMELPKVMRNDKIHWHPLTLHETFVEDDSGEYYCEHCEETRDPRLGVYVCEYCKISLPRIYHIHCVLPELGKVYAKKTHQPSTLEKLSERIARKREEVHAIEEKLGAIENKLKEAKEELDELEEQRDNLLYKDSKNESCV